MTKDELRAKYPQDYDPVFQPSQTRYAAAFGPMLPVLGILLVLAIVLLLAGCCCGFPSRQSNLSYDSGWGGEYHAGGHPLLSK